MSVRSYGGHCSSCSGQCAKHMKESQTLWITEFFHAFFFFLFHFSPFLSAQQAGDNGPLWKIQLDRCIHRRCRLVLGRKIPWCFVEELRQKIKKNLHRTEIEIESNKTSPRSVSGL